MDRVNFDRDKAVDPLLRLLGVQGVVAALLLVAAIAVKLIGGGVYDGCRTQFKHNFEDTTQVSEVLSLLTPEKSAEVSSQPSAPVSVEPAEPDEQDPTSYELDLGQVQKMAEVRLAANSMVRPYTGGRITSEFGYRIHPVSGERKLHGGLDIGLDYGDDIYAAMAGVVEKATESSDYGKFVVIRHSDGLKTLYAHCSKLTVKPNQYVSKGQLIALAGSTGVSTGPHLHFEVRVDGKRINPQIFLPTVGEA